MKEIIRLLYVVVFTQDHSAFGITRRSHISQTHVAARTFQAVYMPVLIQGEQKKSIQNFFSASPTTSYSTLKATIWNEEYKHDVIDTKKNFDQRRISHSLSCTLVVLYTRIQF